MHIRRLTSQIKVAEAKSKGKEYDSKLGKASGDAEAKFSQLRSDAGAKFDETRKETNKAVSDFDAKVEKKASEAKSGVSSWFGSK